MKATLTLIAALATLSFAVRADDASLSPKGQQLIESRRIVSGSTAENLDRSVSSGSPKSVALSNGNRAVSGTTQDLLVRYSGGVSPRALANNPGLGQRFEVAPVK